MKKVSIIFGLIVFLVSLFVFSPAIFADTSSINNEVLRTDLSMKVGDSISEEFVDETGEVNKIVVTKVAEEGPTVAFRSSWLYLRNRKASNGTYHIHYYRGCV